MLAVGSNSGPAQDWEFREIGPQPKAAFAIRPDDRDSLRSGPPPSKTAPPPPAVTLAELNAAELSSGRWAFRFAAQITPFEDQLSIVWPDPVEIISVRLDDEILTARPTTDRLTLPPPRTTAGGLLTVLWLATTPTPPAALTYPRLETPSATLSVPQRLCSVINPPGRVAQSDRPELSSAEQARLRSALDADHLSQQEASPLLSVFAGRPTNSWLLPADQSALPIRWLEPSSPPTYAALRTAGLLALLALVAAWHCFRRPLGWFGCILSLSIAGSLATGHWFWFVPALAAIAVQSWSRLMRLRTRLSHQPAPG
jgi:hypothetical protein